MDNRINDRESALMIATISGIAALADAENETRVALEYLRQDSAGAAFLQGGGEQLIREQQGKLANRRPMPRAYGKFDQQELVEFAADRIMLTRDVVAVTTLITTLDGQTRHQLSTVPQGPQRAELVKAVARRHPASAAWLDEFEAKLAEIEAAQQRRQAEQQAVYEAGAPARALAAAEAEGAVLTLDKAGTGILAPAGTKLSPATVAGLREHKAGVVAILAERAAAAAPVTIA